MSRRMSRVLEPMRFQIPHDLDSSQNLWYICPGKARQSSYVWRVPRNRSFESLLIALETGVSPALYAASAKGQDSNWS